MTDIERNEYLKTEKEAKKAYDEITVDFWYRYEKPAS
jgi:hypothetical protein